MIHIYSIRSDQSANNVMDWLEKYKALYTRINSDNFYDMVNLGNKIANKNDIHWFWKWEFPKFDDKYYATEANNSSFNRALKSEYQQLFQAYFNNCGGKVVNHPHHADIDKLSQINIAQKCGLKVPQTIITSKREDVLLFLGKHGKIITKNMVSTPLFIFDSGFYQTFTSIITNETPLEQSSFFPSLFQAYIEKEFELRIIVIGEQFFSCAILQKKDNGAIDIREAVNNHHADIVPYKLPDEMERKIKLFIKKANLQIASFDFIFSKKKEYVFLEVNPSGQFLGYSEKCNYDIDKVLAEYLITLSNEKN